MKQHPIKHLFMLIIYFFSLIIPITIIGFDLIISKFFKISLSEHQLFILSYLFIGFIALLLYGREFLSSFRYLKKKPLRKLLGILGLYISCQILLILLLTYLKIEPQQTENNNAVIDFISSFPLFVGILIVVILGPFVEEIIFRHILIGELSKVIPSPFAVILSMISFVLLHSHKYPELIYYVPLTASMTLAYLISEKKVSYSYLFHILNNAITVLFVSSGFLTV